MAADPKLAGSGRRSASAALWMVLTLVVFLCDLATAYRAAKEHKVHNIMLYPEKHSWCKPTPIKQVVSHPGCKAIEMENNVCVGACFSFFVPRTIPETPGDELLYYCDSCQPNSISWTTVMLECPDNPSQPSLKKSVELIGNCTCLAVGGKRPLLLAAGGPTETSDALPGDDSSRESFSGEDEDEILSSLETSNHVQADFQDLVQAGGTVVANKSTSALEGATAAVGSDTNTSARERYLKLGEQNPEALLQQAIDDEEDNGEWDQEEEGNLPLLRDEGEATATSRT